MEKSPRGEGRWLWVAPAAIVGGLVVFGVSQLIPEEEHPNWQERLAQRAFELCRAHTPTEKDSLGSGATTAGEIVRIARFVGESNPTPWNQLPANHFVAHCSYAALTSELSPTTTCPNGEVFSLAEPTQILVDDDGQSSPDYTATPVSPMRPCQLPIPNG